MTFKQVKSALQDVADLLEEDKAEKQQSSIEDNVDKVMDILSSRRHWKMAEFCMQCAFVRDQLALVMGTLSPWQTQGDGVVAGIECEFSPWSRQNAKMAISIEPKERIAMVSKNSEGDHASVTGAGSQQQPEGVHVAETDAAAQEENANIDVVAIESEAATESETAPELEMLAESAVVTEPEAAIEPETTIEPETVGGSAVATESETAIEPESVAESEVATESAAVLEPETVAESEAVLEPEAVTESEVATESEAAEIKTEIVAEPKIAAEPEPEPEVVADTDVVVTETVADAPENKQPETAPDPVVNQPLPVAAADYPQADIDMPWRRVEGDAVTDLNTVEQPILSTNPAAPLGDSPWSASQFDNAINVQTVSPVQSAQIVGGQVHVTDGSIPTADDSPWAPPSFVAGEKKNYGVCAYNRDIVPVESIVSHIQRHKSAKPVSELLLDIALNATVQQPGAVVAADSVAVAEAADVGLVSLTEEFQDQAKAADDTIAAVGAPVVVQELAEAEIKLYTETDIQASPTPDKQYAENVSIPVELDSPWMLIQEAAAPVSLHPPLPIIKSQKSVENSGDNPWSNAEKAQPEVVVASGEHSHTTAKNSQPVMIAAHLHSAEVHRSKQKPTLARQSLTEPDVEEPVVANHTDTPTVQVTLQPSSENSTGASVADAELLTTNDAPEKAPIQAQESSSVPSKITDPAMPESKPDGGVASDASPILKAACATSHATSQATVLADDNLDVNIQPNPVNTKCHASEQPHTPVQQASVNDKPKSVDNQKAAVAPAPKSWLEPSAVVMQVQSESIAKWPVKLKKKTASGLPERFFTPSPKQDHAHHEEQNISRPKRPPLVLGRVRAQSRGARSELTAKPTPLQPAEQPAAVGKKSKWTLQLQRMYRHGWSPVLRRAHVGIKDMSNQVDGALVCKTARPTTAKTAINSPMRNGIASSDRQTQELVGARVSAWPVKPAVIYSSALPSAFFAGNDSVVPQPGRAEAPARPRMLGKREIVKDHSRPAKSAVAPRGVVRSAPPSEPLVAQTVGVIRNSQQQDRSDVRGIAQARQQSHRGKPRHAMSPSYATAAPVRHAPEVRAEPMQHTSARQTAGHQQTHARQHAPAREQSSAGRHSYGAATVSRDKPKPSANHPKVKTVPVEPLVVGMFSALGNGANHVLNTGRYTIIGLKAGTEDTFSFFARCLSGNARSAK